MRRRLSVEGRADFEKTRWFGPKEPSLWFAGPRLHEQFFNRGSRTDLFNGAND
jgi:hypothetical protein